MSVVDLYHLNEDGGGLLYALLLKCLHDKASCRGHHVTKGGIVVGGAWVVINSLNQTDAPPKPKPL